MFSICCILVALRLLKTLLNELMITITYQKNERLDINGLTFYELGNYYT